MPLYQYQGIDRSGKQRKGMIEASSPMNARQLLREQELMVSELSEKPLGGSTRILKGEQLASFTLQLSQLILILICHRLPLHLNTS